ncbi:B12-binding domain-containing radical SAM protein [Kiritimatiella glycovorans]|uniref:Radical SAM domain protein n=1 Tax=Kiritimatiella glycovorans TaxID=1307763 RepID=A0A0G3EMJ1_9BACT|nr:radical SAM protein [Kiritimatiella glycovorans]AKJ65324.1 Radical SAM domain protein [Kiritimatiella glycovorans]
MRGVIYNFSGELDEVSHLFPNERLARLAASLERAGHEAVVLDRANFADLISRGADFMRTLGSVGFFDDDPDLTAAAAAEAEAVLAERPQMVLINLWHGSGFKFSRELAAELKRRDPALPLYGVGQKVDWFREHILNLPGNRLDGLVTGLGYETVPRLAAGEDAGTVPGMITGGEEGLIINPAPVTEGGAVPKPSYDGRVYRSIEEKIPVFSLALSNLACPNRCAFCVRPENYGRTLSPRPAEAVFDELRSLHERFGATHFRVEDSTPPPKALTALAQAIRESSLKGKVRLSAFSRVDQNAEEDFEAMKDAGFISLFFGMESLDDAVLANLRKGFTPGEVRDTVERAHAAGLFTVGSFICPTPGETRESMERTLERIAEMRDVLDSVLSLPAGVYPTTAWGRDPDAFGIRLRENYIQELLTYPIKYEVPLRHWKPFPFSYAMMGRPAEEVEFGDIAAVQEEFARRVREDLGIPRVPDYYRLLADRAGRPPEETAMRIVKGIMTRDYRALRDFLRIGAPA